MSSDASVKASTGQVYSIVSVPRTSVPSLLPILRLAEEDDNVLVETINNQVSDDGIYVAKDDSGQPVAVATVEFRENEAELVHLAVDPTRQRQGLGKLLVEHVVSETRKRGKASLVVGTADAGTTTIRFYLKCGFRMDKVVKDYFLERYGWAPGEEALDDGIPIRDAIFFRMDLNPA